MTRHPIHGEAISATGAKAVNINRMEEINDLLADAVHSIARSSDMAERVKYHLYGDANPPKGPEGAEPTYSNFLDMSRHLAKRSNELEDLIRSLLSS